MAETTLPITAATEAKPFARKSLWQRLVDSDPFLFGTDVAGCLTRLSTVTLLNVTAGGGSTVPTFLIEPR